MNVRLVPLACNRPRLGVAVLLLATVVGCAGRAAMKADGSAPQTDGEVTPDADASLGLDADWADAARLGVVAVLTGLNPPDIRLVSLDTTSH